MANIIIGARPLVAHVLQTFRLAEDLKSRGHVVTYALSAIHLRRLVESQGFNFYSLSFLGNPTSTRTSPGLLDKLPLIGQIRRTRRLLKPVNESLMNGPATQAMIDALAPDLVIIDSTAIKYAIPFLARNIPMVMVSPTLPSEWDDDAPHTHSHQIPTASRLSRYYGKWEWVRHRLVRHIKWKMGLTEYSGFRRIAEHYGLSYSQLTNRAPLAVRVRLPQIILCPAAFDFPRAERPNRYFLDSGVWPDYREDAAEQEFPWHRLMPDRPMVYCSFGTRLPEDRHYKESAGRLLKEIIEAFSEQSQFQLVVSVGPSTALSTFGSVPDHVIIVNKWIPQIKVLSHAAVHITHGGFASVRESIECKVPMIVVPFDADQPGNAARVVYHQLGVRVLPNKITGPELVEMSRQVHASPAYKENIHKMKSEFDRQRARQSAADVIEESLAKKSPAQNHP